MSMPPSEIRIDDQILSHVKTRLHSPVSIYGNSDFYARIGPEAWIRRELLLHKTIAEMGFPVAEIFGEGWLDGQYYYLETSLGNEVIWRTFCRDYKDGSAVSPENFRHFAEVAYRYANSQASSLGKRLGTLDFVTGIQAETLFSEVPELKEIAGAAFAKSEDRLSAFPRVFSQGDFNPHNIFPKGVIDFDMGFMAPFWYDLVTAIFHTYAFPPEWIAEISRGYEFTEAQEREYFEMIDRVAIGAWLPKISGFIGDFLIGRMIWAAVRMHDCPLLQKWRYGKLEKIFGMYLEDEDFMGLYRE